MQINKQQLQRQQIVLTHLGHYKHKCDGIWGPESIKAKIAFEHTREFVPALPTRGLPFAEKVKYPKGIRMGADKLLTCDGLDEARINELSSRTPVDKGSTSDSVESTIVAETTTVETTTTENNTQASTSTPEESSDAGNEDTNDQSQLQRNKEKHKNKHKHNRQTSR